MKEVSFVYYFVLIIYYVTDNYHVVKERSEKISTSFLFKCYIQRASVLHSTLYNYSRFFTIHII